MNQPLQMNCPLSHGKASQLIDELNVPQGNRVVDVGCGTGVFLVRLVEWLEAFGMGIDLDGAAIQSAQELARLRGIAERVEFERQDIAAANIANKSFDAGICLGSTHAFAAGEPAFREALAGMSRIVRDGGLLLIGEGFWKQPPVKEYLDFLGEPSGVYRDHQENITLAESIGLTPVLAMTANQDEWDEFEWRHHRGVLAAAEKLSAKEGKERRQRAVAWRNAYLKWGRETMGFGYYLFRNTNSRSCLVG